MMAEDQDIAEQDAGPAEWRGESGVGPEKTSEWAGVIAPETDTLGVLAVHHLRKY